MTRDVSDSEGSEKSRSDRHGGVTVLDQDDDRVPSEEEILEYAEYLGIDVEKEQDLLWIAREGVIAPVPKPWKACTENGDDVFYFNFETGESIWDHPSDERYRQLVIDKRKEKAAASMVRPSKLVYPLDDKQSEVEVTETSKGSESKASTVESKPGSTALDSTTEAQDVKKEHNRPDQSSSMSAEESFSASLSASESASAGKAVPEDKPASQESRSKSSEAKLNLKDSKGSGPGVGIGGAGAKDVASGKIDSGKNKERGGLEEIEEEDGVESPESGSQSAPTTKADAAKGGVDVLDQDDDRVPSEEEILEYAEYLGIDVEKEQDLLWIAREGVIAPVPKPWKACTENGDDVFYFNFETGESIWDHPSDERYRQLVIDKRKEKAAASMVRPSKLVYPLDDKQSEVEVTETSKGSESKASTVESKPGSTALDSTTEAQDVKKEHNRPDQSSSMSAEESFSASLSASESASAGKAVPEDKPASPLASDAVPSAVGLSGVGLGGACLGDPISETNEKAFEDEAKPEPKVVASSASELSEDFMSEASPNSSFVEAPKAVGDTLELSMSATGDLELQAMQLMHSLEADVASLARSLALLRQIRESQRIYMELLLHGTVVTAS